MFHVYIIYSPSLKKFYKGRTEHLEDSLVRHNSGLEATTKEGIPWVLLWSAVKASYPEAVSLERKLINLKTDRIIKFMLNHKEGIPLEEAMHFLEKMVQQKKP